MNGFLKASALVACGFMALQLGTKKAEAQRKSLSKEQIAGLAWKPPFKKAAIRTSETNCEIHQRSQQFSGTSHIPK